MILNVVLSLLWPLFIVISPIIYIVCKIKYKDEKLPEGYASFERRSLAYLIDIILYLIFDYLINTGYSKLSSPLPVPAGIIIWSLSILNIIIIPSITGWSIGKKIVSIKIIKKDNKKAGVVDIIYREIVKNWFSITFLFMGCLWMLFSKNKLTWHDNVADTRIMKIVKADEKIHKVD